MISNNLAILKSCNVSYAKYSSRNFHLTSPSEGVLIPGQHEDGCGAKGDFKPDEVLS